MLSRAAADIKEPHLAKKEIFERDQEQRNVSNGVDHNFAYLEDWSQPRITRYHDPYQIDS